MDISTERYNAIQGFELGYWIGAKAPPNKPWRWYDRVFLDYIPMNCGVAADIGCGPAPYLMNHNVNFKSGVAVDPLIHKYRKLVRYKKYWVKDVVCIDDVDKIVSKSCDTTFCFNTLDHVLDPQRFVAKLGAITRGRIFFMVDVDKLPDRMHPHEIEYAWVISELNKFFRPEMIRTMPSWKFSNHILYYVGLKQ